MLRAVCAKALGQEQLGGVSKAEESGRRVAE